MLRPAPERESPDSWPRRGQGLSDRLDVHSGPGSGPQSLSGDRGAGRCVVGPKAGVSRSACLSRTRLSALDGPLGHRGYHGVSSRVDQPPKKLLGCTSPWLHGDISSQVSCLAGLHVVSFSIDENMIAVRVMKRLGELGTAFVREPERHPNRGWVAASGPTGGSSDRRRGPPRQRVSACRGSFWGAYLM